MRLRLCVCLAASIVLITLFLPSSFGWGENVERLVTNKAVDTLPEDMRPFFEANRNFLVQRVTDPDEAVSRGQGERRNEFIRLDHYGQFPFSSLPRVYNAAVTKFGRQKLDSNGLLPWEVGLYSKRLTDAFRSRNWSDVKLAAAALAHYVAAAHDPFNTTMNEDGKLSNQPGVNERFGAGLVDRYQRFFVVKPNEAIFIHDPTDHAFEMCLDAHSWLENVLLADRRARQGLTGYNDEFYDRFYSQAGAVLIRQLSDATTDIGSYWMTAWINAGRPALPPQ